MKIGARELLNWNGRLSRLQYATIGILAFCAKFALDSLLARGVFHLPWRFANYWRVPFEVTRVEDLPSADARLLLLMLALALPFLWIGVVCTLKRLRDASLRPWWMFFFFVPIVNIAFFTAMCVFPTRDAERARTALAADAAERVAENSDGKWAAAAMAVFGTALAGVLLTLLSVQVLSTYGWGLFVALPFSMGFISVLIYEWSVPRTLGDSIAVTIFSQLIFGSMLLAFAYEGAICILMALPLGLVLAIMGGALAHAVRSGRAAEQTATLAIILLVSPGIAGTERVVRPAAPEFRVVSSVEIAAPPEAVWRQVIAFARIPEPREWYFRAGVAYPIRAEIFGTGPGAERHCVFSTGAFVEPIEIWDEPNLLKFSVGSNPPPLNELSPYGHIDTPHLHGYFASDEGQFRLIRLPNGNTRLEGTTWYHNRIWPAAYWRLWSDAIIHRVHLRVLRHIKVLAEEGTARAPLTEFSANP
ncbi:MAG TPA: DUF805 domain-containing protein [Candidatus Acidoferrales bacterium]|nr:DUF805 domain-containing protein [Candidatus Acidoferrales bacterium]